MVYQVETIPKRIEVLINDYCCIYQPSRYSSFIEDLQKDSDEEAIAELNMREELPIQENHISKNLLSNTEMQNLWKMLKQLSLFWKRMAYC